MKYRNFEKEDLYGALATFNADPFCIENVDYVDEVWSYVKDGFHIILNRYDYEVACDQLNLDFNKDYVIYETDDYKCKFCLDF